MKLKKPRFWDYKKANIFAYLLWPLSTVVGIITRLKIKKKTKNDKIKTICIGNIYVGGTGKTSLSIKVKDILDTKDLKVCFIKKYHPNQIDEQKLLSNYGKLFISTKRQEALNQAIKENYNVAIFDDGLQDSSIKFNLEFVCFNNLNWIGNGMIIPSGPLRESISNLRFYKNVFLNGNEENLVNIKDEIKKINPQININNGRYVPLNIKSFDRNHSYLVFSGIGNHNTFINMLKNYDLKIVEDLEYPDHYQYTKKDLDQIINKARKYNAKILTTEKDYLRLDSFDKSKVLFIRSTLEILDKKNLMKLLIDLNEKN